MQIVLMDAKFACCCRELDDLSIVGMGDPNGLDERLFATIEMVKEHGGVQWWLYASKCRECKQSWMIAQDERIHDNFVFKRIDPAALDAIVENANWPTDFLRFEQVLRIEVKSGKIAQFLDPRSPALMETAHDLRRERPEISVDEIAVVLAIPSKSAAQLLES